MRKKVSRKEILDKLILELINRDRQKGVLHSLGHYREIAEKNLELVIKKIESKDK